ncbi:MAG: Ig-like domain-containing protein [Bacteroidota bacterium]
MIRKNYRSVLRALLACVFIFTVAGRSTGQVISTFAGNKLLEDVHGDYFVSGDLVGLFLDGDGNIYLSDAGRHRVRRIDASTGYVTTIAGSGTDWIDEGFSGDGGNALQAKLANPLSVAKDAAGNIYIPDSYNSRVRKVSPAGIITTIAGDGSASNTGDGGNAVDATIKYPSAIALDNTGNIYIACEGRIRKIDNSGIITTFAGTGVDGYTGDGGPATAAKIGFSYSLCFDTDGNLYFADFSYKVIRKINTLGIISTVAGTGASGYSGDGGPATAATFGFLWAVAVDGPGNLYIGDGNNNVIRKVNTSGIISTFAGTGSSGYSEDGTLAGAAMLQFPTFLACDASGTVYVAEGYRIRKISTSGILSTVAGSKIFRYNGDSAATRATIRAYSLAIDKHGNIFTTHQDDNRLLKITPSGKVSTVAGNGTLTTGGDGGHAADAALSQPLGVACDTSDNVYVLEVFGKIRKINKDGIISSFADAPGSELVCDRAGNVYANADARIYKITPAGTVSPFAGTGVGGFSGDGGPATAATIASPNNMAADIDGNIYIADRGNNRIRKVSVSGIITTVAGTGGSGNTGDGGLATSAEIGLPNSVAVDNSGNIYIAHQNRVRKINTSGIISTITGSDYTDYYGDGGDPLLARMEGPYDLCTDAAGNVYATQVTAIRMISSGSVPPIMGDLTICAGGTGTLRDNITGGTWASGSTGIATIGTSGLITGVSPGTAVITYTTAAGSTTSVVTVNSYPAAITGNSSVCPGIGTTLSNATSGGTWSSSDVLVATVGSANGIVSGTDNGVATISYTVGSCSTTHTVTVSLTAGLISGPQSVLTGSTITMTTDGSGGTWAVSNGNASINTSGILTGVSAGTVTVSYSKTLTCGTVVNTLIVTVNASAGTCNAWETLGTTVSANSAGIPSLALDASGRPYVAYSDATLNMGLVKKWNGSTWEALGSGNFAYSATKDNTLAFDDGGTPYVLYSSAGAGATQLHVKKFSGGAWVNAGDNEPATTSTYWPVMATGAAGVVYIAYMEDGGQLTVRNLSGTSWALTGSAKFTPGMAFYPSIAVDNTGTPYVAFDDIDAGGCSVMKYNGSSWVYVGAAGMLGASGITPSIAINSAGEPHVVYSDFSNSGRATVVKFNGASWALVGTAVSTAGTEYVKIAIDEADKVYITYGDGDNSDKATVKMYNGSSWISLTTPGISAGAGTPFAIAIDAANHPHVVYTDGTNGSKAVVQRYYPQAAIAAITGTTTLATSATTTLSNATAGGTWSSSNAAIATVGTSDGVVSGIAAGTATISYTAGTCSVSVIVTVTSSCTIDPITGTAIVCATATTTLANATAGGTWTSSNAGVATVGSTTGIVTGVAAGVVNITYTTASCSTSVAVTVSAAPATAGTITGTLTVCPTATTTLANATTGGTWSSSNTSVATVGSSTGIVTGVAAGNATITYTVTNSCGSVTTTATVTVNGTPATAGTITGTLALCTTATTTLANATTGGTWSSSNTSVATVGSSTGIVTGVAAGNATITYTVTNSCGSATTTAVVTVNAAPSTAGTVTGTLTVCTTATTTLANATTGGTWSSSNTSVATVGSASGIVAGVAAGNATITYTITNSCGSATTTAVVTVNSTPSTAGTITGALTACTGATTTLSNATTGGTWSSSNTSVATVGSANGIVSGVSAGNATITYTVTNSCGSISATAVVTVSTGGGAITGTTTLCTGTTSTLTAGSGTWTSSNTAVAAVGSATGVVTGVAAGTSVISFISSGGCSAATTVTISSAPPAITGTLKACPGTSTTLANALAGGAWSSSNTAVATIDASTGIATGIIAGTTTISYTLGGSCTRTAVLSVNPTPAAIGGTLSACAGNTVLVTNSTGGGVSWTSSNTTVATVGSTSGMVSALSIGTTTITYTVNTGCYRTATFTVNAGPAAITGAGTVCAGATLTLGNTVSGGTWTSGSTSIATIGASSGIVTGVNGGVASITYNVGGCKVSASVTVSAIAAITGTATMCIGSNTTLYSTGGGTWTSSDAGVAAVGSATGAVTGISGGTATITYTLGSGCARTAVVTVSATAVTIGGTLSVCPGAVTTLTNTAGGGTWNGSNSAVANINTATGILTGVNAGTLNITYTIAGGCKAMTIATVNPVPANMGGALNVCRDQSTTITNASTGGAWSSNNTAIATIGAGTGIATGVAAGNTHITYTLPTGCYRAVSFTVKALPAAIGGSLNVCTTTSAVLSNATSGGVSWTSSSTGVATIGTYSGLLTGVSAGTSTITYTINTGCYITAVATVHTLPSAGAITGPSTVAVSNTITLANAATGGVWSSSHPSRATVDVDGVVTGVSGGTATISYSVSNAGCTVRATKAISVTTSRPGGSAGSGQSMAGNFQLYPNPTTGTFTIQVDEAGSFSIYTLDGKEVSRYDVAQGVTQISLAKELAAGIYMCRYNAASGNTVVVRLVYEH